jgi:hypothetical protein
MWQVFEIYLLQKDEYFEAISYIPVFFVCDLNS